MSKTSEHQPQAPVTSQTLLEFVLFEKRAPALTRHGKPDTATTPHLNAPLQAVLQHTPLQAFITRLKQQLALDGHSQAETESKYTAKYGATKDAEVLEATKAPNLLWLLGIQSSVDY